MYCSGAYFSAIIFLFLPYLYAIPSVFGKKMSTKNASKVITAQAFGEIALTFMGGYLMEWIHPLALFGYILLLTIGLKMSYIMVVNGLMEEKEHKDELPTVELI